jgi:hypothetical protein
MTNNTAITIPSSNVTTVVKLLGMCGSDHAGERATAALKADQLVRGCGLTWADLINVPAQHIARENLPDDWRAMRNFCLQHPDLLRSRELTFVEDLTCWRGMLTSTQKSWLISIFARVNREVSP